VKIKFQTFPASEVTSKEGHKNEINNWWVPTLFSACHVMVFGAATQCYTNT